MVYSLACSGGGKGEEMTLAPMTLEAQSIAHKIERAKTLLAEARTDYERMDIRDQARAAMAAATILGLREVAVAASWLVARAERAIAQANPSRLPGDRGQGRAAKSVDSESTDLANDTLSQMRRAHRDYTDEQFDEMEAASLANPEAPPITRKALTNPTPHLARASGNEAWHTPDDLIELVRAVLGTIELDPASNPVAQERIRAERYHTIEDDGLAQYWYGKVYLNPPYTGGMVDKFADKLIAEYTDGHVPEAIWLSNNSTDTAWFARLSAAASAILFIRGRVKFWTSDADGNESTGSPLQGQVLVYLGEDPSAFIHECQTRECGRGYLSVPAEGSTWL